MGHTQNGRSKQVLKKSIFKHNTDDRTDNSKSGNATTPGVTAKMLEEKVEKLSLKMGWPLLRINYKMLKFSWNTQTLQMQHGSQLIAALQKKKKKPKDYSRSQVDYESTRSWHCKIDTYHSEIHQQEPCLQVIRWEIHCLHLL